MASRKSKSDMEREKVIQNRLQELLKRMIQDEDNKISFAVCEDSVCPSLMKNLPNSASLHVYQSIKV